MRQQYIQQAAIPESAQPILVPVDFSATSEETVLFAARMADSSSVPLIVLHVVHEDVYRSIIYPRMDNKALILPVEEIAEQMLQDFMARMRYQHPDNAVLANAGMIVISGLPLIRIPEIARLKGASLIVMGGSGRSSLAKLITGSVSDKIARQCDVPVAIVHSNGIPREDIGSNAHQADTTTPDRVSEKTRLG